MKLALAGLLVMGTAAVAEAYQLPVGSVTVAPSGATTFRIKAPGHLPGTRAFASYPRKPGARWKRLYLPHVGGGDHELTLQPNDPRLRRAPIGSTGVAFGFQYQAINPEWREGPGHVRPNSWLQAYGHNTQPQPAP
jgi:hypothetical protein